MSVAETSLAPRTEPRRPVGLAWPIILIALGIIFLLETGGFLTESVRRQLVQLWPFALVLLGVDLLMRTRSAAAQLAADTAIVVVALIYLLLAPVVPLFPGGFATTTSYQSSVHVARENAAELNLTMNYGAGKFELRGGLSSVPPALVNVDSTQNDVRVASVERSASRATVIIEPDRETFPFSRGDRAWHVTLPSDLPTTLTLNLGAGDLRADLSAVQVRRATINHGASDLTLIPPVPIGDVQVTLSSGASSIDIQIPAGLEYRVRTTGALISVSGREESSGYAQATNRVTFMITGGATSVAIR